MYRAYKLSNGKYSYNEVELHLERDIDFDQGVDGDLPYPRIHRKLDIIEAVEQPVGEEIRDWMRDSCLKYRVALDYGEPLTAYIFLIFARPWIRRDPKAIAPDTYSWHLVTRRDCTRGCTGPLLKGLQRFGKSPRRGGYAGGAEPQLKDPRKLYIAIDEANSHIKRGWEGTKSMRLLTVLYKGKDIVGSAVGTEIKMLANNDAPRGSASFRLDCDLSSKSEVYGLMPRVRKASVQTSVERVVLLLLQ